MLLNDAWESRSLITGRSCYIANDRCISSFKPQLSHVSDTMSFFCPGTSLQWFKRNRRCQDLKPNLLATFPLLLTKILKHIFRKQCVLSLVHEYLTTQIGIDSWERIFIAVPLHLCSACCMIQGNHAGDELCSKFRCRLIMMYNKGFDSFM